MTAFENRIARQAPPDEQGRDRDTRDTYHRSHTVQLTSITSPESRVCRACSVTAPDLAFFDLSL